MSLEDKCLNNYAANEGIWRATDASVSKKLNAWRGQMHLLQHLTRDVDDVTHCALMKEHFNKLDTSGIGKKYVEERVANVRKLLEECDNREASLHKAAKSDFPVLDETLFEPPCHGLYESCADAEIVQQQLDNLCITDDSEVNLHTATGSLKSKTAVTTAVPRSTHKPMPARNTLVKFLEPLKTAAERADAGSAPASATSDSSGFRTARAELALQQLKQKKKTNAPPTLMNYGAVKKSLGARGIRSSFVPPVARAPAATNGAARAQKQQAIACGNNSDTVDTEAPLNCSPQLAHIEPKLIEIIKSEIMHNYKPIAWTDIAGLEYAKSIIFEAIVYPLRRPDIFTGLRRPPRGVLLFGPPGTGKTLIGKCIASQAKSTFFSVSPSTLTSKWVGDGEKLVKALFAVAAEHQPAVIFMDEIDSLLSQRSTSEHDSMRRLKNEFLIHLDGAATSNDERILIIGATNRPQELDEAARRRFVRRLYIPLPEQAARGQILDNLLKTVHNNLNAAEVAEIAALTAGYSGADIDSLCREAAMEPVRSIPHTQMDDFDLDSVRPVAVQDFRVALKKIRSSVSQQDLEQLEEWNRIFGASK